MIVDPVHPTPPQRRRLWTVTVEEVAYGHPAAAALRAAMVEEARLRYADRLAELPELTGIFEPAAESVVYTGVAVTAERRPVGHVALRWTGAVAGGDIALQRMYVVPRYRGGGVGVALLAAVEATAGALGARRIVLQLGDRQHNAERLYKRAGYTRIPIQSPYEELTFSRCFAKGVGPS
jgi:GNAT superfamily N-acetyltransferase